MPPVNVNPETTAAALDRVTHREDEPWIVVKSAPFTDCNRMPLFTVTKPAYTPLLTHTVSLDAAASIPAWIVNLAVAQFVPAAASLPLVATNHSAASAAWAHPSTREIPITHFHVFMTPALGPP